MSELIKNVGMIIGVATAKRQTKEVEEWGAVCLKRKKKSKLAVNNRCNFGTFQICSSGNQKIKRTQTDPRLRSQHPSSNSGLYY